MVIVVDTNVLLTAISDRSKHHWIYRLIIDKKVHLAVSNEILKEYEEQIANHWHPMVADSVIRVLTELSTTIHTVIYFNLNLINRDLDDNKFVDCAFAANADYIITGDHHFNVLKSIDFPKIPCLQVNDFRKIGEKHRLV